MGKIKINLGTIVELQQQLGKEKRALEAVENNIGRVLNELDMKVSSTEGIKQNLSATRRKARNCTDNLDSLRQVINRAMSDFNSTDRRISAEAKKIGYSGSYSGAGVPSLSSNGGLLLPGIGGLIKAFEISENVMVPIPGVRRVKPDELIASGNLEDNDAEAFAIHDYLTQNGYDASLFFGRFSYATTYVDEDVSGLSVLGYGAREYWKVLEAMFEDAVGGDILDEFIRDEKDCKAILRDIIDSLNGTEALDIYAKDEEKSMKIMNKLIEKAGYELFAETNSTVLNSAEEVEYIYKALQDYSTNVQMLESLKDIAPSSGIFSETIDSLINDYENQVAAIFKEKVIDEIKSGALEVTDELLGTSFGKADFALDLVLGDVPEINGLEKVMSITEMRAQSCNTFRQIAEKIQSGVFTDSDITAYKNAFEVTRSMTIEQYEAMLGSVPEGSNKAYFLQGEIDKLKASTYTNFNFASQYDPNVEYPVPTYNAYGVGGGGGFR